MKKHKESTPKPREFAAKPFAALKGVQAAPVEETTPQPKPVARKVAEREDMDLFLDAMADVQRLQATQRARTEVKQDKQPEKPRARRIDEQEQQLFLQALGSLKLDKTFADEIPEEEAVVRPTPVNRMRQLRRGTIRIDYELDLHGMVRDEAVEALAAFVGGAFKRGQQAVLVITGRGNNSTAEPVLGKAVAAWVRNEGKQMIAEFVGAPPQMGGDGALVLFLKKKEGEA